MSPRPETASTSPTPATTGSSTTKLRPESVPSSEARSGPRHGAEQFEQPTGIAALTAFSELEELWVNDSGNKRLMRYSNSVNTLETPVVSEELKQEASGGLAGAGTGSLAGTVFLVNDKSDTVECLQYGVRPFGGPGSGPGQLNDPADVAVSPTNGDIYVLDTGNDRVEYFNGAEGHVGEYLGQFGEAGTKPGQLKEPKGIAVDPWGHVWVADTGNDRVQELSATGSPIRELGKAIERLPEKQKESKSQKKKREEQEESEPERFKDPIGITFTEEGKLYVVDSGDNRVLTWGFERPEERQLAPGTPPPPSASATWTIEYEVPTSGPAAPRSAGRPAFEQKRPAAPRHGDLPARSAHGLAGEELPTRHNRLPRHKRPHRGHSNTGRRNRHERIQQSKRHRADTQPGQPRTRAQRRRQPKSPRE